MVRNADGEKRAATPPTHASLLEEGVQVLEGAGVEHARREAEWLLADAGDQPGRATLYARPGQPVAPEEAQAFREHLRRRAAGEPLAYVLGHTDFFGLRLTVGPAVLIPRPETEEVVEEALRRLAGVHQPKILDVGTGSGCIALALKAERSDAQVHACDVSSDALAVARANARALKARALHVRFFHADVLDAAAALPRRLDLLVANPPYVPDGESLPEAVRAYEPPAALFSGPDPLCFYRVLVRRASALLAPGGHLVLEAHAHHAQAVAALLDEQALDEQALDEQAFEGVAVRRDAFGRERIVAGRRRTPHASA